MCPETSWTLGQYQIVTRRILELLGFPCPSGIVQPIQTSVGKAGHKCDYVPSVFPIQYGRSGKDEAAERRFARFQKRQTATVPNPMQAHQSNELVIMDNLAAAMDYADGLDAAETLLSLSSSAPEPEPPTKEVAIQTEAVIQIEASQQTVPLSTQDAGIQVESLSSRLRHENEELKKQVAQLQQKKGVTMIEGNDKLTQTFTGLPSWAMFLHLFMFLSPFTYCQGSTLSTENEMFLGLYRM